LFKRIERFIYKSKSEHKHPFDPQRRQFMITSLNFGILGASAIMTGYGLYEARRQPILQNIDIPISKLSPDLEGFKIAQFTDLHIGPTIKRRFVQSVVDQVNGLSADIIVCTGDLVDDFVHNISDDVAPIKDLQATRGVYFVTGNHEYYVGAEPWIDEIERLGLTVLLDENRTIEYNSQNIILAGVSDYRSKQFIPHHKSDPKGALLNSVDSDVKILLAHQPRSIFAASEAGYDLQISGHTHGGQYFPWSMFVTIGQPYVSGLNKHHNTTCAFRSAFRGNFIYTH
jgi:predicted MPP superfamily phosphohydrolase